MHHTQFRQANQRLRYLMDIRPTTPDALHAFVRKAFGLDVGRTAMGAGSTPPFDYLCHAFFHGGDCVVWANRGGGKTMLGAVATLLDLLFKPGIQVRILGGSLEQSGKMYEHLTALLDRPLLRDPSGRSDVLAAPATARRVVLGHGSRVEILAGSQRSVRGTRVHKLRCDEVEEFDPAVWQAAQLVTRSGRLPGFAGGELPGELPGALPGALPGELVRGGVEGLSTMHRPFGLMSQLVGDHPVSPGLCPGSAPHKSAGDETRPRAEPGANGAKHTGAPGLKVFKWNAMDVAATCPAELPCDGCVLWDDCGGRAKLATGFVPIEDLIAQRRRTSDLTWSAEMMCERPGVHDAVYPNFDPTPAGRHVTETPPVPPTADAERGVETSGVGGMDFGLRSPHVMLWARVVGVGVDAAVHVVDEYIVEGLTLDRHLERIDAQAEERGWPSAAELDWVGVDPAGHQRNSHSGRTDIAWLRDAGYRVRSARSRIAEGVEIVRRRLDRGTLTIHPRCTQLIRALQAYRFDPQHPQKREPLKDGPDHACDALRYLLLNLERGGGKARSRSYFFDAFDR